MSPFQAKVEFINKVTKELEGKVDGLSNQLLKLIITKFVDNLETDSGSIKNTPENIRLITEIDKLYQQFMRSKGADIAKAIKDGSDQIGKYNFDYFSEFSTGKAAFEASADKIRQTIDDRLGLGDKTKLKEGGYMDSMLKDTSVANKIKSLSIQEVVKGSGFQNFKKSLETMIVGNTETMGAFKQHFRQYAYDIYVNIDRTEQKLFADELDLKYFTYEGTIIESSREFCIKRAGKVFTTKEAEAWVDDPWIKKNFEKGYIASYDPINDMGLFGCRHIPRFISKEVAESLRPDLAAKGPAPKPKPAPPKSEQPVKSDFVPNGRPFKDQFKEVDTRVETYFTQALNKIDSVHGDGDLPVIPIKWSQAKSYYGKFKREVRVGGDSWMYLSQSAIDEGRAEFTSLHEFGHLIDYHSIGQKWRMESRSNSGLFDDFLKAARDTKAIKNIDLIRNSKSYFNNGIEYRVTTKTIEYLDYLQDRAEIWARAYSQYIAMRSGSKPLMDIVKKEAEHHFTSQWTDEDFKQLAKEIEKILVASGMMKVNQ